jgi:YgiT-type zinc finger domain-containing protein
MPVACTKCPTCGSDKIKKVRRKWTGKFHGQTYLVSRLEFHECPACGEKVYDQEAMRKIEAHSPVYAKARIS